MAVELDMSSERAGRTEVSRSDSDHLSLSLGEQASIAQGLLFN